LYVTAFVVGDGVPHPFPSNVTVYCLGALQLAAVAGALVHIQV
jgi:hypothetical protein